MKKEEALKTITLNLNKELYVALEEIAKADNRSMDDVIISILEEYIEVFKKSYNHINEKDK